MGHDFGGRPRRDAEEYRRPRLRLTHVDTAPALLRALLKHARIAFVDDRDIALVLGRTFEGDALTRRRTAADAAFQAFPKLEAVYCTLRATESVERLAAADPRDIER